MLLRNCVDPSLSRFLCRLIIILIKYAQGSGIYKHCFFWLFCTRLFHEVLLIWFFVCNKQILNLNLNLKCCRLTCAHLTFNAHIQSLTKACYFHIRALRHIRSCINLETAKSFAHAIVSSWLDYGNSLLTGISDLNMHKLQRVQTTHVKPVQSHCDNCTGCLLDSESTSKFLH